MRIYDTRSKTRPFIDCKHTLKLSEEKREAVKAELGRAVSLLRKSERYLMVGFAEGYELYMAGKKLEKGAYVSVSLFGNASSSDYEKMTGMICEVFKELLDIPPSAVYVTYHEVNDWGWDGANF